MEPAGAALPEVLVLSDAAEQLDDRSGRSRSVPLERELRALEGEMPRDLRRQRSHLAREVPVPPVQLPVSGRTLGRHVSLGPGWELNKEGEIMYPSQPSTSHSPEVDPLEVSAGILLERGPPACLPAARPLLLRLAQAHAAASHARAPAALRRHPLRHLSLHCRRPADRRRCRRSTRGRGGRSGCGATRWPRALTATRSRTPSCGGRARCRRMPRCLLASSIARGTTGAARTAGSGRHLATRASLLLPCRPVLMCIAAVA